jgi:hypothetical protein
MILSLNDGGKDRKQPSPSGLSHGPEGYTNKRRCRMGRPKKPGTMTSTHREILRRRGMDPKNFVVVKETYGSLYVRDIRIGKIKIIEKQN